MSQFDEPLLREPNALPPELRVGLERLRDKRPNAERMAAMAAAVGLTAAASTASAATSAAKGAPATGSGALASPLAKLLVVASVVGVGAAAFLLSRPSATPAASAPTAVTAANGASASTVVPANDPAMPGAAGPHRPGAPVRPRSPADAPSVPGALPVAAVEGAALAESPLVAAPIAEVPQGVAKAVAPSRAPAAPGSLPAATDPSPSERAATPRADATPRAPAAAPGHPPAGAAPTEAELLRDARQVLDRNPLVALSLCDEHQSAYPGGKLTQERELIAIAALLRLGRTSSAESRAARFRSSYPSSPYMARLDRLVPP